MTSAETLDQTADRMLAKWSRRYRSDAAYCDAHARALAGNVACQIHLTHLHDDAGFADLQLAAQRAVTRGRRA
jgi:hypothetical protein